MQLGADFGKLADPSAGLVLNIDEQGNLIRATALRTILIGGLNRTIGRLANCFCSFPLHQLGQQLHETDMIQGEMEGQKDFEILYHYRARNLVAVLEQSH